MADVQLTANAVLETVTGMKVNCEARDKKFVLDEPISDGGSDIGMNPIEALLSALGACKAIVTRIAAEKMRIKLESLEVECTGTLNPDGFMGIDANAKIGLSKVNTIFKIKSSASKSEIEKLINFVNTHCPVNDTIANAPELTSTIELKN